MKTVLIQGAMESEISYLVEYFKPTAVETYAGFEFLIADYKNVNVIISQTKIGMINASVSTTIGIMKFKPDIVINQGCAGSAREDLNVGQIIVGESSVYINDFHTNLKKMGEGSNSLEWIPNPKRSYRVQATNWVLEIAKEMANSDVYFGCLGSGDVFSREYDRIHYLRECFGHDAEDMETLAAYKVCEEFNIPHIGFRIISNNELLLTPRDKTTHKTIQEFTVEFVNYLLK